MPESINVGERAGAKNITLSKYDPVRSLDAIEKTSVG